MKKPPNKKVQFLRCLFFSLVTLEASFTQRAEALPNTSEVTAEKYCDFLNHAAATDPDHLYDEKMSTDPEAACIVRLGSPGNFHYNVIAGRENFLVTYVNGIAEKIYTAQTDSFLTNEEERIFFERNLTLACNKNNFSVVTFEASSKLTTGDPNNSGTATDTIEEFFFDHIESIGPVLAILATLGAVRCYYPEAFHAYVISRFEINQGSADMLYRSDQVRTEDTAATSRDHALQIQQKAITAKNDRDLDPSKNNEELWKNTSKETHDIWEIVEDKYDVAINKTRILLTNASPQQQSAVLTKRKNEARYHKLTAAAHEKQAIANIAALEARELKTFEAAKTASHAANEVVAAYETLIHEIPDIAETLHGNGEEGRDVLLTELTGCKTAAQQMAKEWSGIANKRNASSNPLALVTSRSRNDVATEIDGQLLPSPLRSPRAHAHSIDGADLAITIVKPKLSRSSSDDPVNIIKQSRTQAALLDIKAHEALEEARAITSKNPRFEPAWKHAEASLRLALEKRKQVISQATELKSMIPRNEHALWESAILDDQFQRDWRQKELDLLANEKEERKQAAYFFEWDDLPFEQLFKNKSEASKKDHRPAILIDLPPTDDGSGEHK